MEGLRQYALSVVTAAIGCSILCGIAGEGTSRNLLRMLSGLILTLVVIRPAARLELPALDDFLPAYAPEAEAAIAQGQEAAQQTMEDIIISACEAYILDKATALGAEVSVSVTLDADGVPVSVVIWGQLSPGAKQRLETILETDLAIAKENQVWKG